MEKWVFLALGIIKIAACLIINSTENGENSGSVWAFSGGADIAIFGYFVIQGLR